MHMIMEVFTLGGSLDHKSSYFCPPIQQTHLEHRQLSKHSLAGTRPGCSVSQLCPLKRDHVVNRCVVAFEHCFAPIWILKLKFSKTKMVCPFVGRGGRECI